MQAEFGRLIKDEPGFDHDLRAFLGRSYGLKALADYESGSDAHITATQAAEAIAAANLCVESLAVVLGGDTT